VSGSSREASPRRSPLGTSEPSARTRCGWRLTLIPGPTMWRRWLDDYRCVAPTP
jgi:hypothetical protein